MTSRWGTGIIFVCAALMSCTNAPESAFDRPMNRIGTTQRAMTSGPDLTVTAVSGPASASPGMSFGVDVTVCNHGGVGTPATDLEIYLSTDDTITSADDPIGWQPVPSLNPGQCDSQTTTAFGTGLGPDGAP